jgi:hypothetical protein
MQAEPVAEVMVGRQAATSTSERDIKCPVALPPRVTAIAPEPVVPAESACDLEDHQKQKDERRHVLSAAKGLIMKALKAAGLIKS